MPHSSSCIGMVIVALNTPPSVEAGRWVRTYPFDPVASHWPAASAHRLAAMQAVTESLTKKVCAGAHLRATHSAEPLNVHSSAPDPRLHSGAWAEPRCVCWLWDASVGSKSQEASGPHCPIGRSFALRFCFRCHL